MASTKKYSAVLDISAKANFDDLISKLEKVRDNFKSSKNLNANDVIGIKDSLDKIDELQKKLDKIREKGFSSPKDIEDYEKTMERIVDEARDLNQAFNKLHIKDLDREVKQIETDLEKALANIDKKADSFVNKQLKGVKGAEQFGEALKEAAGNAKEVEKVQQDILNDLDKQINKQKALYSEQKTKTLNTALKASGFGYLQTSAFNNGDYGANLKALNQTKEIFGNLIEDKKVTDYDSAIKRLKKDLNEAGIALKESRLTQLDTILKNLYSGPGLAEGAVTLATLRENLTNLNDSVNSLESKKSSLDKFFDSQKFKDLVASLAEGKTSVEQFKAELVAAEKVSQDAKEFRNLPQYMVDAAAATDKASEEVKNFSLELEKASEKQLQFDTLIGRMSSFATRILSITSAYQGLRRVIRSTYNDIKNLDKAFGSIAMVTSYSVADLWEQYGTYAEMANKLGQTTQGVIEASSLYYQQGLDTAEVMSLTEETMKLATLAGLDFQEATSQMTAAIRAFKLEMTDGAHVTDVYAELAAHAAASVNDISQAMSATAAIAHSAGMEFETTAAMLTTMIEATQEAPKNLGTALKAVIARFTELKTNVAGTADSEFEDLDYNKVDKALKSVGISIKDAVGQFRDLDDVFLELSSIWDTLDRNTQRYIATIAAGSRRNITIAPFQIVA